MTTDHSFEANLCANLANSNHLQLSLCKEMSCIPHKLKSALPKKTCGKHQGLLMCKISKQRGNKKHGVSAVICKMECGGADKGRVGENQREVM